MTTRLLILLSAAVLLCWAAPVQGQTIKTLGFNTTNGQVVYSGTNSLTFTNALQFSTNARADTRTNLGGTTLGNSVFTATNTAAAQVAIFGTNVIIYNSAGLEGISLSEGQTKLLNAISFPYLGGSTAAATTRTNLGLGLPALTNTSNVTAMRALAGSTNTNQPFSGSISVVGTNNTNTLVFSNGILLSQ